MKINVLCFILLFGTACSPMANEQVMEKKAHNKVLFFKDAVPKDISGTVISEKIILEIIQLFSTADDIYLYPLYESNIDGFKQNGCVEVIFAESRQMVVEAVNQTEQVTKLLIPLEEEMCRHHAHVVYGNPDYDTFNLLLNSQGCDKLRKLVHKALNSK